MYAYIFVAFINKVMVRLLGYIQSGVIFYTVILVLI